MFNIAKTIKSRRFNLVLSILLLLAISFSLMNIVGATTPNPGHGWAEVGDGTFLVTGPSTGRTFSFPDADATVLTSNSAVTTAEGGTGLTSAGSAGAVLISNGSTWTSGAETKSIWAGQSSASITADAVCMPSGFVTCNTTVTTKHGFIVPTNVTIKNLRAFLATAPAAGSTCAFTVRESTDCASAYTATNLTCSVVGNGSLRTCDDSTNAVNISAGECLQIFYNETGTCSGLITWAFDLAWH